MKLRLAFASVLALSTAACASGTALEALNAMQIVENNPSNGISYASRSGSGGNLTLRDVRFKGNWPDQGAVQSVDKATVAPEGAPTVEAAAPAVMALQEVAKADTLTFTGLDMKNGRPVFTGMVINGVTPTVGMDGTTMRIGSIAIEGMNAATGAFLAGALTKEGPGEAPPFEQWAFSNASIKGFTLAGTIGGDSGEDSAEDSEPAPTGSVKVELGEISFGNVKDRVIGLTRLSGIKGEMDIPGDFPIAGTFDLGTMDYTNLRAGLYADIVMAGMPGADKPADPGKLFAGLTSPLETYFDAFRWTGVKADFSGLKIDVSPASFTTTRDANGVAVAIKSPRTTYKLTADSAGGNLGAMGMMLMAMGGYPSNVVEIYTQGDATFDPQKDMTRYTGYNIGVTDIVDIKVDGGVLGLKQALPTVMAGMMTLMESTNTVTRSVVEEDEDAATEEDDADVDAGEGEDDADTDVDEDAADVSGNPLDAMSPETQGAMMQMVMGLIGLQVTDLDISITDKQLVGLILDQTASSSGQSVEEYRADLVNMVLGSGVFMTDAGIDADLANEATAAIGAFLREPGTLRIQMKPKFPVGAMSLMMSPTKESLGFSATFTPLAPATPN
ncbi:MAG TPA: hypothetical protein PLH23_03810 [Hyphomonadaceae bacterium]|nr:hypothetical protein [Hyphomonadaceae bacterium]HPI47368.1 hypothetical protein [Hyphomonadaceae bacterium]